MTRKSNKYHSTFNATFEGRVTEMERKKNRSQQQRQSLYNNVMANVFFYCLNGMCVLICMGACVMSPSKIYLRLTFFFRVAVCHCANICISVGFWWFVLNLNVVLWHWFCNSLFLCLFIRFGNIQIAMVFVWIYVFIVLIFTVCCVPRGGAGVFFKQNPISIIGPTLYSVFFSFFGWRFGFLIWQSIR